MGYERVVVNAVETAVKIIGQVLDDGATGSYRTWTCNAQIAEVTGTCTDKLNRNAKDSSGIGKKKNENGSRNHCKLKEMLAICMAATGFVFQQENVKTSDPNPLSVCWSDDYI